MPSKSVTHRALVAAALASGTSTIHSPLEADDTRVTRDGLAALGLPARATDGVWLVEGGGGRVPGGAEIELAESGTSMRLLLAVAALGARPSRLDGAPRLRERPVGELAAALTALGARIELSRTSGGLPLRAGGSAPTGGRLRVRAERSSQFASALLLVGPRLAGGLDLELERPAVSLPYVELTARVLSAFGVRVERRGELRWCVAPGDYRGREFRVEGDHSSASYWLAAAAVLGGRVRVEGLDPESAQPDARLSRILADLGCRVETGEDWIEVRGGASIPAFDLDLGDAPDLVPTVAVLALFAGGPCALRGIAHLRHKESDRLEVVAANLRALGREARVEDDGLRIGPRPSQLRAATIATRSDHRMAMAFAIAGLRVAGVVIDAPDCVSKSNPGFWAQLERIEGRS